MEVGGPPAAQGVHPCRLQEGVADDGAFHRAIPFPPRAENGLYLAVFYRRATPDVVRYRVGGDVLVVRERLEPPGSARFRALAGPEPGLGVEVREVFRVVSGVQQKGQANLPAVVDAGGGLGLLLGPESAGSSMAARIAIIAMTTSNSMSVNPLARNLRESPENISLSGAASGPLPPATPSLCGQLRSSLN